MYFVSYIVLYISYASYFEVYDIYLYLNHCTAVQIIPGRGSSPQDSAARYVPMH